MSTLPSRGPTLFLRTNSELHSKMGLSPPPLLYLVLFLPALARTFFSSTAALSRLLLLLPLLLRLLTCIVDSIVNTSGRGGHYREVVLGPVEERDVDDVVVAAVRCIPCGRLVGEASDIARLSVPAEGR